MSEIGCKMSGKSKGHAFTNSGGMNTIASKDISFIFDRPIRNPHAEIELDEHVVDVDSGDVQQRRRIYPAPSTACTVQLQGHVLLIDVPNATSEFRVMMYDDVLPVASVNGMLVVRNLLDYIPDRYKALRNEMDGSIPDRDVLVSFNFSKILQTALVFDEPLRSRPIVRVAYYNVEDAKSGESMFPLYGNVVKGITRQPTSDAYQYSVDSAGRKRDLKRY